jgi:uncharacterized membrane protein YgdD (TMEM256/DUF423 family)
MHRRVNSVEGEMILALGAVLAGLGVAAGAFGAHLLRDQLTAAELDTWRTGASYQMYHSLALIIVARMLGRHASRMLRASYWLFVLGIVLFCGSLYALAIKGNPALGAVTPFGGVALLGGWACLALFAARSGRS